jgi:hypothetical protein
MAYDEATGSAVLFGGYVETSSGPVDVHQTWTYG